MFRALCFSKPLTRLSIAIRALHSLLDGLLFNVVNKLSVYDIKALFPQSRGINALCDLKDHQRYHHLNFGRGKSLKAHNSVLKAGLDTLLAILRTSLP